mgnify:CR=1 FL=1
MKTNEINFNFSKIFITGANGWLGRQLIETLSNGDNDVLENFKPSDYQIRAFLLEGENDIFLDKYSNLNKFKGDISKKDDCDNFFDKSINRSILIHTAGIIHPKKIKDFYDINYKGTVNLINSGIKKGINKFVIISSNSPIGCNKNNKNLFDEKSKYNPYMNYGKSKMLMEKFLISKINQGIDITILRPPWFYGDNMPKRQITFYKMIMNGTVPVVGSGNNLRSKAHVKNIVQGIILSASKSISKGKIYWIADENPYSYNEIISSIREILKNDLKLNVKNSSIKIPYIFGQIAQLADYIIQSVGFYNQKIHVMSELNKNIACSIDLAKKELNYNPKLNLKSGLRNLLLKNKNEFLN